MRYKRAAVVLGLVVVIVIMGQRKIQAANDGIEDYMCYVTNNSQKLPPVLLTLGQKGHVNKYNAFVVTLTTPNGVQCVMAFSDGPDDAPLYVGPTANPCSYFNGGNAPIHTTVKVMGDTIIALAKEGNREVRYSFNRQSGVFINEITGATAQCHEH